MLKAIIFDLDETLIGSADAILHFFRQMYDYIGLPFPEDQKRVFYTASEQGMLEKLIPDPEKQALARKFKREVYDSDGHLDSLVLKPHAIETLESCHGKYKLALATNRGYSTPQVLEHFGMDKYFEIALHAASLKHSKPHPVIVETILKHLEIKPSECLLVGDSHVDVQTASNGGVRCVIVGTNGGLSLGDYRIDDLSELAQLLAHLN